MRKILLLSYLLSVFGVLSSSAQPVEWKDVASIFYDNCATCHRPGEIGDGYIYANSYKALVSDPFGYFTLIPFYIENNLMPPWKADPNYRHFLDERILTPQEIALVDSFVNQVATLGAAYDPGDTSLAPPPPVFATGSQLGTPDTVLTMAQPFTIPGDYTDHYQVFVLHTNLTDDRNVRALEFRPGNPKLVHHVFIYTCLDGSADSLDATTPEYGYPSFGGAGEGVNADFLTLHGPGLTPRFYPEGSGIKLKAGTDIVIQVHYAPSFTEQPDQSSVNIFWEPEVEIRPVKGKRVGENYMLEPVLFIPKNKTVTFHAEYPLDTTYSMFSIAPHMHLIGKEFKIWAVTPSADSIPLCHIPVWDFKWQLLYNFPCFVILPQGTVIHSEASYDNTTNNPNNPNNPPINVHYGESSFDEMNKYFMNLLTYQAGDENVIFDTAICALTDVPSNIGIVSTPQLYSPIPNPAADQITFDYYLPTASDSKMSIYDLTGRVSSAVIEENSSAPGFHRKIINVSEWVPGMYFCTLEVNGRRLTKPFIVHH